MVTADQHLEDGDMTEVLPPPVSVTPPPAPGSPSPAGHAPASSATPAASGLVRPRDGRVLGGVCAGLADRYGWNRRTTRVLAVLSMLLPGPQVLLYLGFWLFVPDGGDGSRIVDVDKARDDLHDIVGSSTSTHR